MYPDGELIRLAAHKAALRGHIRRHRAQCVAAATRVTQPLAWLDRVVAFWRRLSPFAQLAAVPLGLFATRTVFPRRKILGAFVRWGPLVFNAVRGLGSVLKTRSESTPSSNGRR